VLGGKGFGKYVLYKFNKFSLTWKSCTYVDGTVGDTVGMLNAGEEVGEDIVVKLYSSVTPSMKKGMP